MNIATYNIWDSNTNFTTRLELLIIELNKHNIEILALQEVKDIKTFNYIKEESKFPFGFYFDGLAILSKYDIQLQTTYSENNNYLLRVTYNNIAITNVHLDWEKEANRLLGLDQYFGLLEEEIQDTEIILGDFNDIPEELIHFELVSSGFIDTHQEYAHKRNLIPQPTLDIEHNPRWRNTDTTETPYRFDWIMINTESNIEIHNVFLIGTEETNEITPSDHYGLFLEVDL